MRLLWLAILIAPCAFGQEIQYSTSIGGAYSKLDLAVLPSGTKINIRLLPCPTSIPATGFLFSLDDVALASPEKLCPIEYGGDNLLVAFADGVRTIKVGSAAPAVFTVTPPPPEPPASISLTGKGFDWKPGDSTPISGYRVYRSDGTKLAETVAATYDPAASGTYYLTAYTATTESLPSVLINFTLASAPTPAGLKVVAVAPGVNAAPIFGITATSTRGSTVLGFVLVGKPCTGAAIYSYRGAKYYRFAAADAIWWQTKATDAAAVACQ